MDEISKKELLTETGISYGQLYRWKREGLIPEDWFIKRSAFTGQETFFPRDRMLARVNAILALKDTHSLEQIRANLVESSPVQQVKEALLNLSDMSAEFIEGLNAPAGISEISQDSLAAVIGLYEMTVRAQINQNTSTKLIDDALETVALSAQIPSTMSLVEIGKEPHFIAATQATWIATDKGVLFKETIQVADVAERIRAKGTETLDEGTR